MNRVLRTDHGTFELVAIDAPAPGVGALRFLDVDEALRLLRAIASEPTAMTALRTWAQDAGIGPAQDRPLLSQLATALADGRLRIRRDDRLPEGTGPGVPGGTRPPGTSPGRPPPPPPGRVDPPRPPPGPEIITELVVHVKDADGAPVAAANVSAGALGERTTDENGTANYGRVRPGTYDISAEKPGHAPERDGTVGMDEKKRVEVPAGSRTEVDLVQHPQCANVAWFDGPAGAVRGSASRGKYFGFDHKTNLPATEPDTYWKPVPDKGTLAFDGNRFKRDATPWVSVAVGQETELEITFDFKNGECIPCIANTTFEVTPGGVAEVVTQTVTAKKAAFKLKGTGEGEATLMVRCDGRDIGRCHIWSKNLAVIKLDVISIVTPKAPGANIDFAGLSRYLRHTLRQAALDIDIANLGEVDLSGLPAFTVLERGWYRAPALGEFVRFVDDRAHIVALDQFAQLALLMRGPAPGVPPRRPDAYRLYFYVPHLVMDDTMGIVPDIGGRAAFSFLAGDDIAHNVMAHELGHAMTLHHPGNDPPTNQPGRRRGSGPPTQFCQHNHDTLDRPVPAHPATNTEHATAANGGDWNVMANDPANLMGYWWDEPNSWPLRYHQWKAIRRS